MSRRQKSWDREPERAEGQPPYTAPKAGLDWPETPVAKWDTTLEVGFMLLLMGDFRQTRSARQSLQSMHGSVEAAAGRFRSQIVQAPDTLPGIAHAGGVGYWRSVANDLEDLAAEHWSHAQGRPHARPDGTTSHPGTTRVDIFG